MSQSILIFDFASNEEGAQQARHKVEGWKQAFRLGEKLRLKFERVEAEEQSAEAGGDEKPAAEKKAAAKKSAAKKATAKAEESEKKSAETPAHIRILVRLDFSDHEKLSHQRWLDRLKAEEPFKSVEAKTVRQADAEFDNTAELFDSLD